MPLSGNLLVPQEPFELLVRRAIAQLLPPALHCKEAVHEELLRIAEQACPRDAARCGESGDSGGWSSLHQSLYCQRNLHYIT